ncbi:hypothetical protein D1BOALGB6SA_2473 [Olavius sp. associated proteobacterium Delta 1]|nr:hypothetical protein D1BOALGB6SA_2473 [Olavius sp. associated proteobacterium Delta 1]
MENSIQISHRSNKIILSPRSFTILIIQWLGVCILIPAMLFLVATLYSIFIGSNRDILIGSLFTIPTCAVAFLMIYYAQKYISRIFVDREKNIIAIVKKGKRTTTYHLDDIQSLSSQKIAYSFPGFRNYKLYIIKKDGEKLILFNEDLIFSGDRWDNFASDLSIKINKVLKKSTEVRDKIL